VKDSLVFDHYPLPKNALPEGWALVSIAQIAKLVASGFPSGQHNQNAKGVPHIRPMNIDRDGRLDLSFLKYVEGEVPRELKKGDVLFNNTNSPELIGKTTAVLVDTRLGYSNHMTRIRLEDRLNPTFIARQLHFLWMCGYFRHRCVNHVNQASISADPLSETVPVLLPPVGEQERIADALDELLSDLDAGVAALERVRDKLKLYRAAVLKAAVEGALTSEWRKERLQTEPASELLKHILVERRRRWEEEQLRKFKEKDREPPKNWKTKYKEPMAPNTTDLPPPPEGWCWASMDQVAWSAGYGTSEKCRDSNTGLAVLRIPNIIGGSISLHDLKFAPSTYVERDEDLVSVGDLLIVRTNGSRMLIGHGAVVRDAPAVPLSFASYLIRLRLVPDPSLLGWLALIWDSSVVRRWIEARAATSAGQYNISLGVLETLAVPLPPVVEQRIIVESVEGQLSIIDHLESDLAARLTSAQALRQSILRHAFSGKLVPQDPNDEPASELLKRIAAEREQRAREAAAAKRPNGQTPRHAAKPRGKATRARATKKESEYGRIADR
jgi:type I restriction enzyme, S subunit